MVFLAIVVVVALIFGINVGLAETFDDERFERLLVWVEEHGGQVSKKLSLGRNENGVRGLFVNDYVAEDEVLLEIPSRIIFNGIGPCESVTELASEIRLGNESFWWPFLAMDEGLEAEIPNFWSDEAVAALQGLPPAQDARRHTEWFSNSCMKNRRSYEQLDKATKTALSLLVSRFCDRGHVPIYPLANHHNGLLNMQITVVKGDGNEFQFRISASQEIPAGMEVFNSYSNGFTSDMLRDYGFIEDWPTMWRFVWLGREHSFLAFNDVSILLEPNERTTATDQKTREELIVEAMEEMATKPIRILQTFAADAENFLASLPTTAKEDEELLNTDNSLEDERLAITFRKKYKVLIQQAASVARLQLEKKEL